MTENSYWTCPPDAPVPGSGTHSLTVVLPGAGGPWTEWPANDPDRAREFAAALGTVEAVLGYEGERTIAEAFSSATRADLDLIRVGVWGDVLAVSDPALVDDGDAWPVLAQVEALATRFPGATVIGEASVGRGARHEEAAWSVPGHPPVHSEGRPDSDDPSHWTLTGAPWPLLAALGVTPERAKAADVAYAPDDPAATYWAGLGELILGDRRPWRRRKVRTSVFRVRHTREATDRMEELWLGGGA